MLVDELEKNKCSGCYGCANVCPKDAISMERDFEGFVYPKIDRQKCIECGLCSKMCPSINKPIVNNNSNPEIYAAWTNDEEIRINSTSGGVFSEIAIEFLKKGGWVCGARYNENHYIEHCLINSLDGLKIIRQSKYAQSDIGLTYRKIKELLKKGERVLFCGTPCECSGLINILGENREGLTIVDFVCRGANSPKAYEKYLESLEKEYNSKVKKVWFKNKTYGWNRFSTKIEFENGESYLEDRYHDTFMIGYIQYNLYMRPSCAECSFKDMPRVSDITLADFWGIKLDDEDKDIEKGTSLVIVNSAKGQEIFDSIKERLFWEDKCIEDAVIANPCIFTSPVMNKRRKYFFDNLDKMDFQVLVRKCIKVSLPRKIVRKIKKIIKNNKG